MLESPKSAPEVQTSYPSKSPPPHTAAPLDLSFKGFASINDIAEDIKDHHQKNLLRSADSQKFSCSAVKLNNNEMTELTEFVDTMSTIVESIDDIAWIDLSFNDLEKVDEDLLQFRNLKALHLHGNNISQLEEINKLAILSQLRSLTTHGNPIESEKDYKLYILSRFPNLKSLDFSAITKQDRSKAEVWSKMRPKGPRKQRLHKNS